MLFRACLQSRDAEDKELRRKERALAPGPAAYNTAVRTGLCRAYLAASVVGSSLVVSASKTGGMGKVCLCCCPGPGVKLCIYMWPGFCVGVLLFILWTSFCGVVAFFGLGQLFIVRFSCFPFRACVATTNLIQ